MTPSHKFSLVPLALAVTLAFPAAAPAFTYIDVNGVDGSVWARLAVADQADNLRYNLSEGSTLRSLTDLELQVIRNAVLRWSDILGPVATVPEIVIVPDSEVIQNAAAVSAVVSGTDVTRLQACVLGTVGCESGIYSAQDGTQIYFWVMPDLLTASLGDLNPLSHAGIGFPMTGVAFHEVAHALGLATYAVSSGDGQWTLASGMTTRFAKGLADVYETSLAEADHIEILDISKVGSTSSDSGSGKVFYVLTQADTLRSRRASGVKFTGVNVSEVIGDGTAIYFAETNLIDPTTNDLVEASETNSVTGGVPVNGYEENRGLELSHLELQNSLLSHQAWRNWQVPMEAELALFQDLGYTFDRKRFFGTSIYASSTETTITQAFTARENYAWTDAPSTQESAVGVHVYGSGNTVTIAADQLADGAESFGVRVDGLRNAVTLAGGFKVTADGTNGTGIAFTYGREHTLTLESGSTVSASGTGGKALVFDFGDNCVGNGVEYRGSYIRATMNEDTGVWTNTGDAGVLTAFTAELMTAVNIAGTVSAPQGQAVYISPNAHVKTISLLEGAAVTGDIVSEWNALSTIETTDSAKTLVAQVNLGTGYDVQARITLSGDTIPDLTTNLVFGSSSLSYDGNITGANGIRLTFKEGSSTTYSGTAAVLGVVLENGATVKGPGTYILTAAPDSDSDARARVSDAKFRQGMFVNYGTLWSSGATGNVTIQGDYVQAAGSALVVGLRSTGVINPLKVTGDAMTSNDSDTETETESGSEASAATLLAASSAETLTLQFLPEESYFKSGTVMTASEASGVVVQDSDTGISTDVFTSQSFITDTTLLDSISVTLDFAPASDGSTLTTTRIENAYTKALAEGNPSASGTEQSLAAILDANAETVTSANAQALVAAIDFTPDTETIAGMIGDLRGDAHLSAVRAQFAVERLVDRTLARTPANEAVTGRHIWAQPFGGRLADNTAGAHSRTKAAGVAGGVTVTEPGQEIGWQVAAAYFSESNNLHAKTRGEGLWLGASLANAFAGGEKWWFDLSGRIGLANVKTERLQTVLGSSQEVEGTRISATLAGRIGPRLELADVLSVRPAVGLTGTVLRTPSKTEDKVGGLAIDDAWYRSLRAQIGVSAETAPISSAVTGFSWKWTANAGYERELLQDAGEFTAGIAGMTGSFSQRVDWNDRNRWLIGGGLELANEKGFTAALRLEGEMTHGDGAAVTGGAELRWRF
ncbi:autotransporter outer membrane beta-barrel domain-containing protein [Sutterella sp.]|uniref:autotransporter outer membrane beta-barrel domain-containing protein n=1 Tax=Sutterella sp. TaxID=1981025 RepID=UPI0026E10278|nr:autotransporter outer membrane beta-barrel domain-containing protein [Sutterella sp.]MDO5531629.1 autotransporter outer membrane beta-barrel domain-containing protein [Sutterella sp.]